ANQNLFAFEAYRLDDLRQKLTCSADERSRLQIFIGSRSFADKHQSSLAVALGMHNVCSLLMKRAPHTISYAGPDLFKRLLRLRERGRGGSKISKQSISRRAHIPSRGYCRRDFSRK